MGGKGSVRRIEFHGNFLNRSCVEASYAGYNILASSCLFQLFKDHNKTFYYPIIFLLIIDNDLSVI